MDRESNLIECSNPKCHALYEASWHHKGVAVKIGRRHYCKASCAKEHAEALRQNEREQP